MASQKLIIKGARTHNLKNVSLSVPKNKLVVFTGVSGSGKSSLVFDTIYAEGQRRYVESLSSYARQFLGVTDKPDVDSIEGISPAIAIDQKSVSKNPRSTVGTITEIYDYVRLLFAHIGKPHCPTCGSRIQASSARDIMKMIIDRKGEVTILAPLITGRKGEHRAILHEVQVGGFIRVRLDGYIMAIGEALGKQLDSKKKHSVDVVIDRLQITKDLDTVRLLDSIETALKIGKGTLVAVGRPDRPVGRVDGRVVLGEQIFSEKLACTTCGFSMRTPEPRTFSFNNPYGACEACSGLGTKMEVDPDLVIPNKKLSIAEGAVKPWMTASHRVGRQGWYWWILRQMADKYHFSLEKPITSLSEKVFTIILYGDEDIEGVIPNLERRYKETESEWTRAEIEKYMNITDCPLCQGRRLKLEALAVKIGPENIDGVVRKSIGDALHFFIGLSHVARFSSAEEKIAAPIVKEVVNRLRFLERVGLEYLTLARSSGTLSGGEAQRIRLATQLGSRLSGVFYILDEPSVGLHARDQQRLIDTMKELRDLGNSVLVVEHDSLTMREADYIIDIGPGAGKNGGKVIFNGTPAALKKAPTLTGQYLSGEKIVNGLITNQKLKINSTAGGQKDKVHFKRAQEKMLVVKGAQHNNLKNINVRIPLGEFVCVTGVSGSGKSSLVSDIIAKALVRELHGAHTIPGKHKAIEGIQQLDKAVVVDQSPIGRTPRSNPATYTGAFSHIRDLFAATHEARVRGYQAGRFSFNVKGGRCETCRGGGVTKVEMFFMPDIYVECDACGGMRYNKEVLEVEYKGKNIAEVLAMTVEEALSFFKNIPPLEAKLGVLEQVGLGYLQLGQQAPSLSGGEAQRVKLATELARRATGRTFYILDEPTTGLHPDDVNKLLVVLKDLVRMGNTVLIIEHTMDVIKNADWLIDLGPEGGDEGGKVVAEGTPEQVSKIKKSYTGQFLAKIL